ncbi:MAG: hypothetical protein IJB54_05460, partial [Firmicutes bacterium]|nr:hypothetical protein [Bacillota bacterium]
MGYDKDTRRFGNTSGNDRYMSDEQRARQQAYEEYLSLRENRAPRGNYVKNDDLYGSYFSNGRREDRSRDEIREEYMRARRENSIEDTPYGRSEMRRNNKKDQIARQGRVNKADKDMFEDRPSRREEEKPSRSRTKRKEKAAKKAAKGKK